MENEILNRLIINAEKHFKIADHMTYVSYPLINEVKLLMNITDNINKCFINCVEAILYYEKIYKHITYYPEDYESQLGFFWKNVSKRYSLNYDDIKLLLDLYNIVKDHKKSSMVFVRKNKYVITSDRFRMKTLTIEDVKKYLAKAKVFILILRRLV